MEEALKKVELHNYIDFVVGLIGCIGTALLGPGGNIFLIFYIAHLAVLRKPDEREQLLFAKAYSYAFHGFYVLVVIAQFCCTKLFNPPFVIALLIFLRGLFGIIVFARN